MNSATTGQVIERFAHVGTEKIFQWVEWVLVMGAVEYVAQAQNLFAARILTVVLTGLMGLNLGVTVMEATRPASSRRLVLWTHLLIGLALVTALQWWIGDLVSAVVASQGKT
jgi:hypothetical protein